jgi:carbon storage regulator CsrA
MLVLTRKLQQQVKIGDQITVTILKVKGNTVRLGIEAPRDVRVIRGELPKGAAQTEEASVTQASLSLSLESGELEADLDAQHDEHELAAQPDHSQAGSPRLPQLRAFDRYGGAPLTSFVAHAVLAK